MQQDLGTTYLQVTIKRYKYYKDLADKTLEQLTDAQIHYQPNEASNSIAIIMQHMWGNMLSRWTNFLIEDGEKIWRERDAEFENQQLSKMQLLEKWEAGWNCLFNTLEKLSTEDLLKTITIRQEPLTVVDAINRQLAHYPYHVGQIVFLGKLILNDSWHNLSIEKGKSDEFNLSMQ